MPVLYLDIDTYSVHVNVSPSEYVINVTSILTQTYHMVSVLVTSRYTYCHIAWLSLLL